MGGASGSSCDAPLLGLQSWLVELFTSQYQSETSLYLAKGQNTSVRSFAADNVFADSTTYQMCSIASNAATGGYDTELKVGIYA